ncbi:hypothetical protein [Bernardetia sp.]|uniref:hypothetical protein n=1 Tax=Bernardetia sp. TaxID=1937974 RepID=UPI0025B804BD|nr:hypothetical protein [Bernardetia sp.]
MATQKRKPTPKKTHQQTANSKITECVLLVSVFYLCFAIYEATLNPFAWSFDIRNAFGTCLMIGFSILLFIKWK